MMVAATIAGPRLRPRLILVTCCLSLFMVAMDATIVNVALPSIQHDLAASTAGLQWTLDGYTLVVASLLMLAGSMADRFGRRLVFQIGMSLFCLGSVLCGLAPGVGWLVAFRVIQALGGSMLNPVAMAIITNTFIEPRERARAIGVWGAVSGIAMAAGPLAGGFLTQAIGWRAIFWINVPIGLAAIVLSGLFIPESRAARARRIDAVGQGLVIVILAAFIGGVIEGPRLGWASPATIGLFVLAAAALCGLLAYEPRHPEPLLDFKLFRSVPFTGATIIALCSFGAFGAFLFLTSLYLQNVRGYSAFQAGLCTLPVALLTVVCSPIAGRLVERVGARTPLLWSGIATALSALMLTRLQADSPLWFLLSAYAVFGIGFGLVNPPITFTAIAGLPRDRAGLAAGIASASRQTGTSFGVALAGTIAGASLAGPMATASHFMWWIIFCCGLCVALVGLVSTSPWGLATTRHVAHLFAEEGRP